jgi:hypothetical protein
MLTKTIFVRDYKVDPISNEPLAIVRYKLFGFIPIFTRKIFFEGKTQFAAKEDYYLEESLRGLTDRII